VASAEIAVVPSLYEGFSLPAVEHMANWCQCILEYLLSELSRKSQKARSLDDLDFEDLFAVHCR
jgi:hypothetical protein